MARTISTSIATGVTLGSGDNPVTVTPSGYVSGPDGIDGPAGTNWTITNQSTVLGTTKYGISLAQGGTVTNSVGGSIAGPTTGVYIYAATAGTDTGLVVNYGDISGTSGFLGGFGIYMKAVGQVTNMATGTIQSGSGIKIAGTNAVVDNLGRITGSYNYSGGYGVYLRESGTVLNGSSTALIQGYEGVIFQSSPITLPGTLSNYGTILGTGTETGAVNVSGGGNLTNGGSGASAALIQGGRFGVAFGLGATINNFATIAATGSFGGETGVYVSSGPAIVNNLGSAALISGYIGASVAYGTVTNSGTIASTLGAGGTAVNFVSGSNLLVVDPAAVFVGTVVGSGFNSNKIELAAGGAGTINNLGTSFTNFGTMVVDAAATWTLSGPTSIKDIGSTGAVTIGAGADLEVTGALSTGDAFVLNGGTLHIAGTVDAASSFDMAGAPADDLRVDSVTGTTFDNAITGFGTQDTIVLPGVAFAAGGSVTSGGGTLSVPLLGGGSFTFSNFTTEGAPGFTVGANSLSGSVACFAAGTHIRTERGEVPVESLRHGDSVVLADGRVSPVKWVGRRAMDCRRHPDPRAVWPVRVAAGALGSGLPVRDLMLSPDHALYLDGVLIPARLLLNGASIVQIRMNFGGMICCARKASRRRVTSTPAIARCSRMVDNRCGCIRISRPPNTHGNPARARLLLRRRNAWSRSGERSRNERKRWDGRCPNRRRWWTIRICMC